MEEPGSHGAERMAAWHEEHNGVTEKGGKATGYERLIVEQPPSRSGKYLKEHMEEHGNRPEWAFGRSGGQDKPIDIYDYEKGFSAEDMSRIRDYLALPTLDAEAEPRTRREEQIRDYVVLQKKFGRLRKKFKVLNLRINLFTGSDKAEPLFAERPYLRNRLEQLLPSLEALFSYDEKADYSGGKYKKLLAKFGFAASPDGVPLLTQTYKVISGKAWL